MKGTSLLLLLLGPMIVESGGAFATDLRQEYFELKRVTNSMYRNGSLALTTLEQDAVGLIHCGSLLYEVGPEYGTLEATLQGLGDAVIYTREVLTAAGYPRKLWLERLVEEEEKQLLRLEKKIGTVVGGGNDEDVDADLEGKLLGELAYEFHDPLIEDLNRYRQNDAPQLPQVYRGGECGDGEIEIPVLMDPADGRVWFISEFYYLLCQARGVDPDDREDCKHWKEQTGVPVSMVAGNYRYAALWPDGSLREGAISFINAFDEGDVFKISR